MSRNVKYNVICTQYHLPSQKYLIDKSLLDGLLIKNATSASNSPWVKSAISERGSVWTNPATLVSTMPSYTSASIPLKV